MAFAEIQTGALLSAVFEKDHPHLEKKITAFSLQAKAIQQKEKLPGFIILTQIQGKKVRIDLFAGLSEPQSTAQKGAVQQVVSSLDDTTFRKRIEGSLKKDRERGAKLAMDRPQVKGVGLRPLRK